MSKCVVTGGAGFIGSHLTDALVSRGYQVTVVDDLSAGKRENINPAAKLVVGNIIHPGEIRGAFQGATTVFHLAAIPRVPRSIEDPIGTGMVNMNGTWNVLREASEAGVRRVVYASSSSIYGDQPRLPLVEDMRPNPLSPYAMQKWAGELMCGAFNGDHMRAVSLRFFNVYGPRFDPSGPYALVIGKFIAARMRGEAMTICGDGEQTRDFTHVSDVVGACLEAAHRPTRRGVAVCNIGASRPVSVNAIAKLIGGPTETIAARVGEPRHTYADTTKARALLGWKPKVTIEDGIAQLKVEIGLE